MTKDEALKLALEALEYAGPSWIDARQPAINAIKEALAQPVQDCSMYAGVRMWVGDRHVMQCLTKLEFTRAVIEPQRLLELVAERCIKEVSNG